MTALTVDRNTPGREGVDFEFGVKAAAKLYAGSLVCIDSTGYAVRGSATPGLAAIGVAQALADNSAGADGAIRVKVRRGVWRLANSGVNPLTDANIGAACYIEDDQTVGSSPVGKSFAGIVLDVETSGVWVDIGRLPYPSANDAYIAETTITSAQLLALFAAPQIIVPAPGAGKAIVLVDATLHKPAGVAYAGIAVGEDLSIKYTGAAGAELAQIETTGFLDQATAQTRHVKAAAAAAVAPVDNAVLALHLLVGEIITGDSPLKLRTRYQIINTAW